MSGSGVNRKHLIVAGLVGAAAGVGIALLSPTIAQNASNLISPQKPDNCLIRDILQIGGMLPIESAPVSSTSEGSNNSFQCKICEKDIKIEPSITLDCSHLFHRKCLFSNYLVQTQINSAETFKCPVTACKYGISDSILQSLMHHH